MPATMSVVEKVVLQGRRFRIAQELFEGKLG
jgi:hypothetical protein